MITIGLDFKIFGNGRGLGAPFFDQPFYWLVDRQTKRGNFYTFCAGFGAQLSSFQWTHPRPQERRLLAGLEFVPYQSHRQRGRVCVSWAVELRRDLRAADFPLIESRLRNSSSYLIPWGELCGENVP